MTSDVDLRLGVRGRVTSGERAGRWVLIDSVGMTVVDRLVVVTSDDLDMPQHPSEQVEWVAPEDLDSRLADWGIEWTVISDDVTGERFAP